MKLEAYTDENLLIALTEPEAHRIEKLNVKSSIVIKSSSFIIFFFYINSFGRCQLLSHYKFSFSNRISKGKNFSGQFYIQFIHNEHLIISLAKKGTNTQFV